MSCIVPRTCTEIPADGPARDAMSRPLDEYRDVPAYVLLGDPGAGKTTAFERERGALGTDGVFVSARDFLAFDLESRPEWREGTIFIDGLDEVRAGASDARTPFDAVRGKLDRLGRPRFRLSCRAADWLGANDRTRLAKVSPDARLAVLRLDPLTYWDVGAILEALPRVGDSDGFVLEARERGVDGFLTNPQSLLMLAEAVAGGDDWPASRLDLFEAACRQMARERNSEHVAAAGPRAAGPLSADGAALEEVLDAAGRLCAVQLMSGTAGYALPAESETDDFLAFDRCAHGWDTAGDSAAHAKLLRTALATKLFRASPNGGAQPVHRHVAEFLGARHVAGLIGSDTGRGLPVGRVLALLAGGDGIVVTPLRGFSAWLAALCPDARRDLVERDPVGVGLYGDVSGFSTDEKRALLASLARQTSRQFQVFGMADRDPLAAFAPLVTSDMEPAFKDALTAPRLKERPAFARFVLLLLAHPERRRRVADQSRRRGPSADGPRLPSISSALLDVVRGSASSPGARSAALDAFVRHREDGSEKTIEFRELLDDVHAGRVADPDDELRGTLLTELYPHALSPSDVWEYCSPPSNQESSGSYFLFLSRTVVERCSDGQVAEHLDALAVRQGAAAPLLECLWLKDLLMGLLARGLELHGDEIDTKRLYDWLGVNLTPFELPGADDGSQRIRAWLERHPDTQKSVFAEGLRRAATDSALFRGAYDVWPRLHDSTLPADFGLWYLRQAEAASDRRVAEYLLKCAFDAVCDQKCNDGLSVDVLIEHARAHPVLADAFSKLSVCHLDDPRSRRGEHIRRRQRHREEDRRRRQAWVDHVRSCQDALRANRGAPHLLHQMAAAYFGCLLEVEGENPRARLDNLFLGDDRLVEVALNALRGAVGRSDVPELDEIIRLRERDREHRLALPFLAGLAERDRTAPDAPSRLDDRQMRTALAFLCCGVSPQEPPWYRRLLVSDPEQVAEVLIRCAASELRGGRAHVRGIEALARDDNHATVAAVASLRILRSFPVRCTAQQLVYLNYLLWSALRHADHASFKDLIGRKLSRTSLNVAQRARWLAAGFVLSSDSFSDRLLEFARSGERRVRELAAFLGGSQDAAVWSDRLETTGLQVLVRLLGSSFGPYAWPASGIVQATPAVEASDHVRRMIRRLAESPAGAAGAALDALASDECLVEWRDELIRARDEQRAIRRDAAYRHPDVEQVCRTLKNGPPANAGDLAAFVGHRLDEIAQQVRTGNDNGWRLYWNESKHRRAAEPKHEDSCRDALIGVLRQRLPHEVDVQPEGRYANDRRADIRVACRDFQIPVEIKKHCHRDLWSALRNQLLAQYTIDPATGGCGIYLVFWFGEDENAERPRLPPPPAGSRPGSPDELKARLEEGLTADEARRISVRVIDVSAPGSASTSRRRLAPEPQASAPPPSSVTARTGSSERAR